MLGFILQTVDNICKLKIIFNVTVTYVTLRVISLSQLYLDGFVCIILSNQTIVNILTMIKPSAVNTIDGTHHFQENWNFEEDLYIISIRNYPTIFNYPTIHCLKS
jgi:hypothetical protein